MPTCLFGEWLRRENRRVDARAELRIAHELFVEIGMEAFADRARSELQATGEHVRARAPEARDDLTAQERQIAEMARDGLSNPEIGARLFLSPRTVEWHLRHVFAKLGIKSRRDLAGALPKSAARVRARMSLRGRASECATLDTLLADVRRGRAGRWCCGVKPELGRRRCSSIWASRHRD